MSAVAVETSRVPAPSAHVARSRARRARGRSRCAAGARRPPGSGSRAAVRAGRHELQVPDDRSRSTATRTRPRGMYESAAPPSSRRARHVAQVGPLPRASRSRCRGRALEGRLSDDESARKPTSDAEAHRLRRRRTRWPRDPATVSRQLPSWARSRAPVRGGPSHASPRAASGRARLRELDAAAAEPPWDLARGSRPRWCRTSTVTDVPARRQLRRLWHASTLGRACDLDLALRSTRAPTFQTSWLPSLRVDGGGSARNARWREPRAARVLSVADASAGHRADRDMRRGGARRGRRRGRDRAHLRRRRRAHVAGSLGRRGDGRGDRRGRPRVRGRDRVALGPPPPARAALPRDAARRTGRAARRRRARRCGATRSDVPARTTAATTPTRSGSPRRPRSWPRIRSSSPARRSARATRAGRSGR